MLRTATITIPEQDQFVTLRQRLYSVTDVQASSYLPAPLSRQDATPRHNEYVIIRVMNTVIDRATANQGSLSIYCNSQVYNRALYGRLPDNLPTLLEDISNGAAKTSKDLHKLVPWNFVNPRQILESGTPIPTILRQV